MEYKSITQVPTYTSLQDTAIAIENHLESRTIAIKKLSKPQSLREFINITNDSLYDLEQTIKLLYIRDVAQKEQIEALLEKKNKGDDLLNNIKKYSNGLDELNKPDGNKCPNCGSSLNPNNQVKRGSKSFQRCSICGWIEGGEWEQAQEILKEIKKLCKRLAKEILELSNMIMNFVSEHRTIFSLAVAGISYFFGLPGDGISKFFMVFCELWQYIYNFLDDMIDKW